MIKEGFYNQAMDEIKTLKAGMKSLQAQLTAKEKEIEYQGKVGSQQFEAQRVEIERLKAEAKRYKEALEQIKAIQPCSILRTVRDFADQALKGEEE
jgi:capsule polysaccharide export protein KpsE/RkpR